MAETASEPNAIQRFAFEIQSAFDSTVETELDPGQGEDGKWCLRIFKCRWYLLFFRRRGELLFEMEWLPPLRFGLVEGGVLRRRFHGKSAYSRAYWTVRRRLAQA